MYKLYINCLFYVYTDAYVIIYGQVFTLQLVLLPKWPRDDKNFSTIKTQ